MNHPILGKISPDPIGQMLDSSYRRLVRAKCVKWKICNLRLNDLR